MSQRISIQFEGSDKQAAEAARTLAVALREVQGVSVERERSSDETLDFGATLVLVLGSPAIVAAANAIAKWAVRSNQTRITIESGRTVVTNLDSKDAAAVIEAIRGGEGR